MRFLKLSVQLQLKRYHQCGLTRGARQREPLNGQWECTWYALSAHMLVAPLGVRPGIRQAQPLAAWPDGLLDMQ